MLAALLLAAFNLRPTITSMAAILRMVGEHFGLSATAEGVLTTLPVLCLGAFAPLAPWLAQRWSAERIMAGALTLLAAALLLRPWLGLLGLFVGTVAAGGAIGVLGVLLPAVVKRDFPRQASLMTGLYTAILSIGAAAAAGVTEPLRLAFGGSWQWALAFWLVPAALAALVCLLRTPAAQARAATRQPIGRMLRDPLAWQVTFFMGLQSSLAYIVFGWLPTILADRGMSVVAAGLALSVSIAVQIFSAIGSPLLGRRMRDQRVLIAGSLFCTLVGLAGLLYAPLASVWLWIPILGIGQGASFTLALSLLALRAPDITSAGQLSAMAQGFGYLLAALGPLIAGFIHDLAGNWQATGVLYAVIGVLALFAGLGAGRNRTIQAG